MTEAKIPLETDRLVGARVRLARRTAKLSQTDLADRVGRTFQQIQKYEKGINRISAGVLFEISKALDRNLDWFFIDASMLKGEALTDEDSDDFEDCLRLLIDLRRSNSLSTVRELLGFIALSEQKVPSEIAASQANPKAIPVDQKNTKIDSFQADIIPHNT